MTQRITKNTSIPPSTTVYILIFLVIFYFIANDVCVTFKVWNKMVNNIMQSLYKSTKMLANCKQETRHKHAALL